MIIYLIYLPVCVIVAVYILSPLRFLCAKSSTVITTPTDRRARLPPSPFVSGTKSMWCPAPTSSTTPAYSPGYRYNGGAPYADKEFDRFLVWSVLEYPLRNRSSATLRP